MNTIVGNDDWRPRPWIAAVLGFFFGGVGLLYVQRPWWAITAFLFMPQRPVRDWAGTVPGDSYFVLGDSRDNARDSRYAGFVPRDHIVGRVVKIVKEPIRR